MKEETFCALWKEWSKKWHETAEYDISIWNPQKREMEKKHIIVKDYCNVIQGRESELWRLYEKSKENVKRIYLYGDDIKINRFRRAAVLSYVLSSAMTLSYNEENYTKFFGELIEGCSIKQLPDPLYLKQRLAIHCAVESIIMEYDRNDVISLTGKPIFSIPRMASWEENKVDDFLSSVCKELFFSDVYGNQNVLALANMFWVLTQLSSLNKFEPLGPA